MQKTKNLELPIYDNPELDVFDLEDWNLANQNIDVAYEEMANFKQDIAKVNADAEVVEARKGKTTLGDKIDEIDSSLEQIETIKANNGKVDGIQTQLNNLVLGAVGNGNNAEVVQARGNFNVLNERLDKNDISLNSVSEEVWEVQVAKKNTGHTKTDGSTSTSNYNISIDVLEGEEYWIKSTSGWDLKPYVLLNASSGVVSYYPTSESSQVYHNYTLNPIKVKIPSGVTKLVVNSFDTTWLEAKKYIYNKLKTSAVKELPESIINIQNLNPLLKPLFGESYKNISFSLATGFMQSTGTINTSTAQYTKIPVLKGEKYKITTNYGYNLCPYVLLNNDSVVIDYLSSDSPSNITTKSFMYEIKADGILYVNTYNNFAISIQKLIGYKMADTTLNILYNKKAIFFGDSITEGVGSWADLGTIRNKNNMTGSNFGVGGSKYTVTASADNSNCIYNRIKAQYATNSDADYIILSGLVNDALQGMPIGTMLSKTDFTTECDTSKVYGAFEMAIRFVLENWKGKKVGFVITPNIPSSARLNDYFDVARNVCEKYSVPYLDLYKSSGLCVGLKSIKDTYYKGDDIHPNIEGYEKYINDKVETFMKSL